MARKGKDPLELSDLVRAVQETAAGASPLERVTVAVKYGEALKALGDELVGHFVEEARTSGCSWAQIGAHLGVTKQAAQQRHTIRQLFRGRRTQRGGIGPLGRFTAEGRRVVVVAQDEARRLNHNYLGTEHLLLGILRNRDSRAARVLRDLGVSAQRVRSAVKRMIGEGSDPVAGQVPFTPRAKKVLSLGVAAARSAGESLAGPEHLLLGLLEEGEGVAAQILADSGVTRHAVEDSLRK